MRSRERSSQRSGGRDRGGLKQGQGHPPPRTRGPSREGEREKTTEVAVIHRSVESRQDNTQGQASLFPNEKMRRRKRRRRNLKESPKSSERPCERPECPRDEPPPSAEHLSIRHLGVWAFSPPRSIRRPRSCVLRRSQALSWGRTVQRSRSEKLQSLTRPSPSGVSPLTLRVSSRSTSGHFCFSSKNLMKTLAPSELMSQTRSGGISFKKKNTPQSQVRFVWLLPPDAT